jgi:isopentenyl-diphosphate delta-isomerase
MNSADNPRFTGATDEDAVILVDAKDNILGTAPKLDAHRRGLKHRAVSALVRNADGLMLLQRRAAGKYHSARLWSNACCSHPRPDESVATAVRRRLIEEMGVDCPLTPLFNTSYRAAVSDDLIEDEVVHVFGGMHDGAVAPDAAEVSEWKWMSLSDLTADQQAHPDRYTVWFLHYMRQYRRAIADWLGKPVGSNRVRPAPR